MGFPFGTVNWGPFANPGKTGNKQRSGPTAFQEGSPAGRAGSRRRRGPPRGRGRGAPSPVEAGKTQSPITKNGEKGNQGRPTGVFLTAHVSWTHGRPKAPGACCLLDDRGRGNYPPRQGPHSPRGGRGGPRPIGRAPVRGPQCLGWGKRPPPRARRESARQSSVEVSWGGGGFTRDRKAP